MSLPVHPPSPRHSSLLLFLLLSLPLLISAQQSFFSSLLHLCAYNPSAISDLTLTLNQSIVGQEAAVSSTLDLLSSHISSIDQSTKALVLSFHGMTGTGKTYLSTTIASHLFASFASSSPSPHSHHFHGMSFSDPSLVSHYRQQLYSSIISSIQQCPLSLFIFEEIHYMHPDVLSYLLPLFTHHAKHDSLSLTQATYLFTSNIGGKAIQKTAFDAERQSIPRHLIAYPLLTQQIQSSFGAQPLRLLVEHAVVNRYVAFFPLFKSHVRQCVGKEMEGRRREMVQAGEVYDLQWGQDLVDYVASFLDYVGPISVSGCKGVRDVVTTAVMGEVRKLNRLSDAGWWRRRRWVLDEYRVRIGVREREAGEEEGGVGVEEVVEVTLEKVDEEAERKVRQLENARGAAEGMSAEKKGAEAALPVAQPVMKAKRNANADETVRARETGEKRAVPSSPLSNGKGAPIPSHVRLPSESPPLTSSEKGEL